MKAICHGATAATTTVLWGFATLVAITGCGSDPSFTEVRNDGNTRGQTVGAASTDSEDPSSIDATAAGAPSTVHGAGAPGDKTGDGSKANDTDRANGKGHDGNGAADGTDAADGGAADGGAVDGAGAADGGMADGGGADTSPTADGGAGDGAGGDGAGGDGAVPPGVEPPILVEDGGTLDLPGEKVAKVGINFEDLPNGDFDYNDAVLCFTGAFKIDGSNVVSYKKQKIVATTFSASGCSHRIDVRIINADGTVKTFSYSSREQQPIEMEFDVLSKLEVTMTPVTNTQSCSNGTTTQHDLTYVKVLLDQCNLSGN
jgi:hypothetical protein